ncbi:hypothetical protein FNO01nite_08040 [Flavobacterium noncentrifugens]|uniref:Por secretion system C-terminal sorting domain-containing protein n=1 Tax=Flavobacterium noncentrifugens TaxID=1128970 RepID=A0A1G8T964_9FLAO|nr:M12 family metallo-peptidase [Flavobacterium noncentrifugens]GEP50132.1 hypothetical protein FNO01nite_08040 [Flavobacterium noncentrifugens]SDJ37971.1 Por secretion system C-terminal sorting domain-containing protein [Flavobacterium noncentrifugens]
MKRIITIVVLFVSIGIFAQRNVAKKVNDLISNNASFQQLSLFSTATAIENEEIKKVVENATYAKLNTTVLAEAMLHKYENIELLLPYQGRNITVQLYQVNIFAEGFHLDTNENKAVSYNPGIYYRGIVKGDADSVVSFSLFNDEVNGVVSADGINNLVIGKLVKKGNTLDYIIYSDSNLKVANTFNCATKEESSKEISVETKTQGTLSAKCVTIFLEIDHDLYERNDSNTTTTNNWATAVFNNIQTLYSNDGISISLKSVYIWTTEDPYSGSDSSDYLFQFHNNTCVFDGDLGQLLGIDPGGLGGVAVGINGFCTQSNFSYTDVNFEFATVPVFSWTIEATTHEFGHLMGSQHTHGCWWNGNNTAIDGCGSSVGYVEGNCEQGPIPSITEKGTIMSYCHLLNNVGIKLSNGFGPQPAARILSNVNNAGCLGPNCNNTCINTVCSVTVSNVTSSTATVNWSETNASTTSWQLSIIPFNSPTDNWTTVNSATFNVADLLPNTFYRARISPDCGATFTAPSSEALFLTSAAYCNGIVMTDTGGASGNYQDDQSYVRTIIPNLPAKKIKLTFTAFSLENDFDYLYLYDGNSTSANDLSNGGFTGSQNPGSFTSTAADGSLTLKFYSDGGVVDDGYVANVACEQRLATEDFAQNIDFTYYPNPTNGSLNIVSTTAMSELAVYNLAGQMLYNNKINGLNAKVDMSAYAVGTYFFKLKFNEKEVNFKIQKN